MGDDVLDGLSSFDLDFGWNVYRIWWLLDLLGIAGKDLNLVWRR